MQSELQRSTVHSYVYQVSLGAIQVLSYTELRQGPTCRLAWLLMLLGLAWIRFLSHMAPVSVKLLLFLRFQASNV